MLACTVSDWLCHCLIGLAAHISGKKRVQGKCATFTFIWKVGQYYCYQGSVELTVKLQDDAHVFDRDDKRKGPNDEG